MQQNLYIKAETVTYLMLTNLDLHFSANAVIDISPGLYQTEPQFHDQSERCV